MPHARPATSAAASAGDEPGLPDRGSYGSRFLRGRLGDKQGLRKKYKGSEWEPVGWQRPLAPPHAREARDRSNSGYKIARDQFPEAVAVWEEGAFAKTGDFLWAGPFLTVNEKVADVLRQFDLGEGELVPVPLFKADLETPWPAPYFYINYGGPKDTFQPEQSRNVQFRLKVPATGQEIYDVPFKIADGDIALSAAARAGGAVWIEQKIRSRLFLSEELVVALLDTGINVDLRLAKCRIVEG